MHRSNDDVERGLAQPEEEDINDNPRAAVFRMHTAVAGFRRLVNTIGTPKDNIQLRQRLHNTRLQIGQLVKETSTKLKQVADHHHNNHPQVPALKTFFQLQPVEEIASAKIAKDVQSVLREFQKAHLLAAERDAFFTPEAEDSHNNAALRSPNNVEQISFLECMRENECDLAEREEGSKVIQKQMNEVNGIIRDLADLVHDQGITIEGITTNTEPCHTAIAQSTSQLAKESTNHSSQSSSSMTCLLLVMLGVILLILVILFALKMASGERAHRPQHITRILIVSHLLNRDTHL